MPKDSSGLFDDSLNNQDSSGLFNNLSNQDSSGLFDTQKTSIEQYTKSFNENATIIEIGEVKQEYNK